MNNDTVDERVPETVDYVVTVERRYGPASEKDRNKSYSCSSVTIYSQTFASDPSHAVAHAANAPFVSQLNS